jgi:hypothetical protein
MGNSTECRTATPDLGPVMFRSMKYVTCNADLHAGARLRLNVLPLGAARSLRLREQIVGKQASSRRIHGQAGARNHRESKHPDQANGVTKPPYTPSVRPLGEAL